MPVWKKGSWVPLFTWLLKLGYSQTTLTTCERARLRKGKTEVTLRRLGPTENIRASSKRPDKSSLSGVPLTYHEGSKKAEGFASFPAKSLSDGRLE